MDLESARLLPEDVTASWGQDTYANIVTDACAWMLHASSVCVCACVCSQPCFATGVSLHSPLLDQLFALTAVDQTVVTASVTVIVTTGDYRKLAGVAQPTRQVFAAQCLNQTVVSWTVAATQKCK